jgi:DNA polymerase III epsilon subunit-like protein
MKTPNEVLISVDVETAGPYPGRYSLLSIGACCVTDPTLTFYAELQPLSFDALPDALAISGLQLEVLAQRGVPPPEAMLNFAAWVQTIADGAHPVFVGFNAPFDWMFINDYFHRYLGYNPFGHNALDIKSYFAGRTGAAWSETSLRHVTARYGGDPTLSHNALADAIDQASLMAAMLAEHAASKTSEDGCTGTRARAEVNYDA